LQSNKVHAELPRVWGLSMSSHSWTDVWKLFLEKMSGESIVMQIAIGLGVALVAVMVLEGLRASFFPKRILEAVALRNAAAPLAPTPSAPPAMDVKQEDMRAAWMAPVQPAYAQSLAYARQARITVNPQTYRRSSPQQLRIIGQRKPS
jgi:hypothetical protein